MVSHNILCIEYRAFEGVAVCLDMGAEQMPHKETLRHGFTSKNLSLGLTRLRSIKLYNYDPSSCIPVAYI